MNVTTLADPMFRTTYPNITILDHVLGTYEAFIFMAIIFISCMVFHEFGHYIAAKSEGFNAKITFEGRKLQTVYEGHATQAQKNAITWAGIGYGFVPIILTAIVHQFYILLLAPYIIGCFGDVMQLKKVKE